MQSKNKKIIVIVVLVIVAVCVFLFAPFGTFQIGNNVISGEYYDTPLEAYNHGDMNFDVQEEIATIDISKKSAIWLAYTDDDCIAVEGMSVNDGKYFDLNDTAVFDCQRENIPSDEVLFSDTKVEYALVTENSYKDYKPNSYYNSKKFSYTGKNGKKTNLIFLYHINDKE